MAGAMNSGRPILSYGFPQSATALTLDESEHEVRVVFPVNPKWVYVLWIVASLALAIGQAGLGLAIVVIFCRSLRVPVLTAFWIAGEWELGALLWGIVGVYGLWKYRRWGRVPRVLTADENGLTLSRLGWWRMSEKRWPRRQITAVELRPAAGNLSRRRAVADLYVCRSKGWRVHFRLSSVDRDLPLRIAQRLAFVLGCPLNDSSWK